MKATDLVEDVKDVGTVQFLNDRLNTNTPKSIRPKNRKPPKSNRVLSCETCDIEIPENVRVWTKPPYLTLFASHEASFTRIFIESICCSAHSDYWNDILFLIDYRSALKKDKYEAVDVIDGKLGKEIHLCKYVSGLPETVIIGITAGRRTLRVTLHNEDGFVFGRDIDLAYEILSNITFYTPREPRKSGELDSLKPLSL